jgi:hypothetical protein
MRREDLVREMALPRVVALTCLMLFAAPAAAGAEPEDAAAVQTVYQAIAPRIYAEYDFHMRGIAQQVLGSGAPASKIETFQHRLKLLTYNRAALIATCVAEAERDRPATAVPVPWDQNLMLTTCVAEKTNQVQKFSQLSAYADFFFPERIEQCGEQARLPDREQMLKPYDFLMLDQPKLYDFERYNECLMKR